MKKKRERDREGVCYQGKRESIRRRTILKTPYNKRRRLSQSFRVRKEGEDKSTDRRRLLVERRRRDAFFVVVVVVFEEEEEED